MEVYSKSIKGRSQKAWKIMRKTGIENSQKKKEEESKMKVNEDESVTVLLCLYRVASVHNIVLNRAETDFFLVTEL